MKVAEKGLLKWIIANYRETTESQLFLNFNRKDKPHLHNKNKDD